MSGSLVGGVWVRRFVLGVALFVAWSAASGPGSVWLSAQSGSITGAPTTVTQPSSDATRFWPEWRGPLHTGVAPHAQPPIEWSEGTNIRWKIEIPGLGSATPVVWGDRLFVLTAVPTDARSSSGPGFFRRLTTRIMRGVSATHVQRFIVLALDRRDGSVIWEHLAHEAAPHEGTHGTGTWASPSAVTDGEVVCAFFGSSGLYCYDFDGDPLWETDLGDMQIKMSFGEGASPTIYRDLLIVPWDHEGESFIVAFDKRTGRERWRTARNEKTSWTSPLVVELEEGAQIVTSATGAVRSYNVESGELLWLDQGVTENAIPSPVAGDGLVFVTSGYRGSRLAAIDLATATGDITGSPAVVWSVDRDTPYVPSPVLLDGQLYVLKSNSGVLTAYDARSGDVRYGPERLPGIRNVYASPVAAGGRLYVTSREGTTLVVRAGPIFEVLATNVLDDGFDASPAVVDGEIYLRGRQFLYAIASD
ncbi:MAG: PQQ-binding-like beta-propeller repeat protein [Acidobacteriota bacterium]|nr:PQQ-binding-like beta-propeller repeat protein [Acidobacteriota bacterium]